MKIDLIPSEDPKDRTPQLYVVTDDYDTELEFREGGGMRLVRFAIKGLLTEKPNEAQAEAYSAICSGHYNLTLQHRNGKYHPLCTPEHYKVA